MKKTLIAGAIGLMSFSGVALADEYSSSTTTHTDPVLGTQSSTHIDQSATSGDGTLTEKKSITHSTSSMASPAGSSETVIQKKSTTTTDN